MPSLRVAISNLRGSPMFALLFSLNLAVGLTGYTLLDTFKTSFKKSMEDQSQKMATGDVQISGRRIFSSKEVQTAEQTLANWLTDKTHVTSMYSMVAGSEGSRLAQVYAIEPNYPLYGEIIVKNNGKTVPQASLHELEKSAWVYPELLSQLAIKPGDSIKIGTQAFTVQGSVEEDAGAAWVGAAVAPRVYISQKHVEETDLIKKGSSVWNTYLYKVRSDSDLKSITERLKSELDDPAIRIRSHYEASDRAGRLINYLNDYLGLVSLAAFFLAAIGATFLYRSYINRKLADTATLISLGMPPSNAFFIAVLELFLLSIIASLGSIAISAALLPIFSSLLMEFFPASIALELQWSSIAATILLAQIGSFGVCLPLIAAARKVKPSLLFQESRHQQLNLDAKNLLLFLPGVMLFWIAACWQARSLFVGSIFFITLLCGGLLTLGLGSLLIRRFRTDRPHMHWSTRMALLYLQRQRFASLACIVALALGAMLMSLVPSLRASLQSEVERPDNDSLPSLFLFDVQDEQKGGFEALLQAQGVQASLVSPLIRARLKTLNGKPFQRKEGRDLETREQEQSRRMSNRGFNLSYRAELDSSEEIVEGRIYQGPWRQETSDLPEISLEVRFAERLELKMGDILEFDVLGVPISGRVTSLRKIRWTSFSPNFFVQFQPGALEDAPKTFVAAIPSVSATKKSDLQNAIVEQFPNISIIDVSRLVQRIIEIADRMSWALGFMAAFCFIAGILVLYSIARQQMRLRYWDITMYKILGGELSHIRRGVYLEFAILSATASLFGVGLAQIASYGTSRLVFDGVYQIDLIVPISVCLLVIAAALFAATIASRRVLSAKPLEFLKN